MLSAAMALVAALQVPGPAATQPMIYGPGVSWSCGEWTAAHVASANRPNSPPDEPFFRSVTLDAWLYGFISGIEFAHAMMPKDAGIMGDLPATVTAEFRLRLERTDATAMSAWMNGYCATHPLEKVYEAAQILVLELHRRALTR